MHLTKHHGLGNDFLITWTADVPADAAELARELCNRHTGIGADGLVFGVGSHPVTFVLFNADGSPAEVSGNGLRCFGQALAMAEGTETIEITVGTAAGPKAISVLGSVAGVHHTLDVVVDMGSASPGPDLSGRHPERHLTCVQSLSVDFGNPHIVVEVEDAMAHDMAVIGPQIEADFQPVGINVHLVSRVEGGGVIMNIWERGAGVTQACGSGACAAAVAAHQWGWSAGASTDVPVFMPGGRAIVSVGDTVRLRGPATFVASIEVPRG